MSISFVGKIIYSLLFLSYLSDSFGAFKKIVINKEEAVVIKEFSGLGIPWAIEFLSPDDLLVTIRSGKILRLNLKTKSKIEISGLPQVNAKGQGGLLDIKLSLNFKNDKKLYFTYSKRVKNGVTTALAEAILENNRLLGVKDLFIAQTNSNKGQHFGSRITLGQDKIFLSVGDRGYRDRAQNLLFHNGKILRVNVDGSIPQDNPFVGRENALPEIYSYGHRNPQGLFYDSETKKLWSGEHGPRGGDEINIVESGKNYGWPVITHGREYWGPSIGEGTSKEGMESPKHFYVPSIAPSGLIVYSGKIFHSLKGQVIQGALKLRHMNILKPLKNDRYEELRILQDIGRMRTVSESPLGDIFFSTDSGNIYRLTRSSNGKN